MSWDLGKEETDEVLRSMFSFLAAIIKQNPQRGILGTMDCLVCEGKATVSYTRSTYNGHLHAQCSACGMGVME